LKIRDKIFVLEKLATEFKPSKIKRSFPERQMIIALAVSMIRGERGTCWWYLCCTRQARIRGVLPLETTFHM